MPRPRNNSPRVLGPKFVASRQKFRVTTVDPGSAGSRGRGVDRWFVEEEEAKDFAERVRAKLSLLAGTTVSAALTQYEQHLAETWKPKSIVELMRRLRLFFSPVSDRQVARLDGERAAQLYDAFRKGRSVDYHRNALGNAKGFLGWCVRQKLATTNALADVDGVGNRSGGKLQLTGDEARRFYATALRMAEQGDEGALGAAMLLSMGLRQSEVRHRRVRDLDLDGTVLRIEHAKTRKGNRIVAVPDDLRPLLLELAEDRGALEVLFPTPDGGEHTKSWLHIAVKRVCNAAAVPVVCPHGLRGTHATLALDLGVGLRAVADALGHEETRTTTRHYAEQGAGEGAQAARALRVISGGRR